MKKGRFLWSAHRITERQKAGKARNIKGKQLKNSRNTVSKQLVEHHSSPNVNLTFTKNIRRIFIPEVSASGIFLKQITKQILVFEHIQRQKSAKTIPNETACTVIYMKFFILSVAIGNEFGSMR